MPESESMIVTDRNRVGCGEGRRSGGGVTRRCWPRPFLSESGWIGMGKVISVINRVVEIVRYWRTVYHPQLTGHGAGEPRTCRVERPFQLLIRFSWDDWVGKCVADRWRSGS